MHVQDVWDFNDALEDVAEMELPCLIWRVGEEPAEKTTQFVCLLEPDKIFVSESIIHTNRRHLTLRDSGLTIGAQPVALFTEMLLSWR